MYVIVVCRYTTENLLEYIDKIFIAEILRKIYSYFLISINIENLTINKTIYPPIVK